MKDRIIQLMESQHMNQQSFSNFIGINPATLNSILKERTRPTLNIVEAICEKMPRVSMTWLVKGQGDMYLPDPTPTADNDGLLPFTDDDPSASSSSPSSPSGRQSQYTVGNLFDASSDEPASPQTPTRQAQRMTRQPLQQIQVTAKNVDKQPRRITEIRVFYDDQTWESFVPKK